MSLRDAKRQKSEEQLELPLGYRGEAPNDQRSVEASMVANGNERSSDDCLMEQVVEEGNRQLAVKRVRQNKGSPGIDGMSVEELPRYLEGNWIRIREELLAGTYQPQMVKRVEIPKAAGGIRELGIPTVVDRMIQQMILNVLQPKFDPTFSAHSYGFRPVSIRI
jgi:RNA-directed DNA polymerase